MAETVLTYTYRLYPKRSQETLLTEQLDAARQLYNAALTQRREAYRLQRRSVTYYDQAAELKEVRVSEPELAGMNFLLLQGVLRRLDRAFVAYFARVRAGKGGGFPRYRAPGHWQLVLTLRGEALALARAQRRLARCRHLPPQHGRKRAARVAVGRLHRRVRRARTDFHHKTARDLARAYALIVAEDLRIANLVRRPAPILGVRADDGAEVHLPNGAATKSGLAKSILGAGWRGFLDLLSYKAASAGGRVILVNPAGSSRECPACGRKAKKTPAARRHECPCGLVINGDVAAALILRARGLASLDLASKQTSP